LLMLQRLARKKYKIDNSLLPKKYAGYDQVATTTTIILCLHSIMHHCKLERLSMRARLQSTGKLHHDIQHNDIQHNDTQHNDIQHNDIQHNDIKHNDIQHNDIKHNDIKHNNK